MNPIMKDLLIISEKMQGIDTFMNIKGNIEALDPSRDVYKEFHGHVELLRKVVEGFSKEMGR